jgi:hypothetical protein
MVGNAVVRTEVDEATKAEAAMGIRRGPRGRDRAPSLGCHGSADLAILSHPALSSRHPTPREDP